MVHKRKAAGKTAKVPAKVIQAEEFEKIAFGWELLSIFDGKKTIDLTKVEYREDGDQIMASLPDFINIQESHVGFGKTQEEAKKNLVKAIYDSVGKDGFSPFEGDYDKRFYDVRLPDGEIVLNCWPNAGFMNETTVYDDGTRQRQWSAGECEYRVAVKDPYEMSREEEEKQREEEEKERALHSIRFGRLPEWKHKGWQVVFFFGTFPNPEIPADLLRGWKTILFGIFKVKELPTEGQEIQSENIRWSILQLQVWLPFDRFGKL